MKYSHVFIIVATVWLFITCFAEKREDRAEARWVFLGYASAGALWRIAENGEKNK